MHANELIRLVDGQERERALELAAALTSSALYADKGASTANAWTSSTSG
jgi:hypothetical protein